MFKKKKTLRKYKKLIFKPDPFYGSYWMTKFANKFMKCGKKHAVESATFNAFHIIKRKSKKVSLNFFLTYLLKFRPLLGFISKRFGRKFKKIPIPLYPRRQTIISLKWLVISIRINRAHSLQKRLISEFLNLQEGKKTPLWKRYSDHTRELNENRLNHRYRWK